MTTDLSLCYTTKLSAYRMTPSVLARLAGLIIISLPSLLLRLSVLTHAFSIFSIPCRATLANQGHIGWVPPAPAVLSVVKVSSSIMPALSHALICRLIFGHVCSFVSNALWFMVSKHFLMSASSTYLPFGALFMFR
jgi:hypothetical protein